MQFMDETWKPIPGFEGRYEVSDHGRVRSLDRVVQRSCGPFPRKGKILKISKDGDGYPKLSLGRGFQRRIHVLVALAFIPNPENLPEIDHEDTNKLNCRAENLSWVSKAENSRRRHDKGSKTCVQTITPEKVVEIQRRIAEGIAVMHVAKEFGVSRVHVRRLCAPLNTFTCGHCGVTFVRTAGFEYRYCSRGCGTAAWRVRQRAEMSATVGALACLNP